jgi:uncharacterized protein (TIGR03437 family)
MKLIKHNLSTCAVILVAAGIAGINFHFRSLTSAGERVRADSALRKRVGDAYLQLPLRFEANRGQAGPQARFVARGAGYALFLTEAEAVLRLRKGGDGAATATLRLRPVAANPAPSIHGLDELPGRTSYFAGSRRLDDIPGFGRVRYENVWHGIDLIYYGNQQQFEYDFHLAPGADPKLIRLSFNGADDMKIGAGGDLEVRAGDAKMRWLKPVAYHEVDGERRAIECVYRLKGKNQIEFDLGAYDKGQPLIIDPALVYSTYLGGLFSDNAFGVAIDGAGNAYVAGSTDSMDFPTVNPVQSSLASRNRTDAFVLKIAPNGSSLVYSTFLGGAGNDAAYAIAVDESGNATIAGETDSTDFPRTPGSLQQSSGGFADAFVARLSATGSQLIYSALLGGNYNDCVFGLAIDSGGNAYLTGQTDSSNFPATGTARSNNIIPFFKSADAAATWSGSGGGLPNATVRSIAFNPAAATTVFAATAYGLFRSANSGGQWTFNGSLPSVSGAEPLVNAVAFDPKTPSIVYLATSQGVYKSFNGGASFQLRSIGLASGNIFAIVVDPVVASTLYAGTQNGVFKSSNGGESWLPANTVTGDGLGSTIVRSLAMDPSNPATIYAGTSRGIFKTTNGATNWTAVNTGLAAAGSAAPNITSLAIDPIAPMTLYAGAATAATVLFKTTDGGARWLPSDNGMTATVGGAMMRMSPVALAVNPSTPATVYAATPLGVFKTPDGGGNWSLSSAGLVTRNITALAIDPASANTVLAGTVAGSDAFAAKLNASGSALVYSIYLGGDQIDIGRGIAVDGAGAAWVTGETDSPNFPVAAPLQTGLRGMGDAFVAKVNPAGSALAFSTYLGGGSTETGNSIALDGSGRAYVAGTTSSNNFPVMNPFRSAFGGGASDGFVTGYKSDGSAIEYSTYLGGQDSDQIFAVAVDRTGSVWVTGTTRSSNFPAVNSLKEFNFDDGFVSRFNPAGTQLIFSSFIGGRFGSTTGRAIVVDSASNAYVAGTTSAFEFPLVNSIPASNSPPNGFAVKLGPVPDLSVAMTASPEPVLAGARLTYAVTVTSAGELPVTGVKLTDRLPQGATLVSATASQGSCAGTSDVSCDLGNMVEGSTARVTIVVNAPATRTASNTVSVSANETEPKTGNNSATVTSNIETADLALTNTGTHLLAPPGARLSWAITVRNLSRVKTGEIVVNDALPAETTFVSCATTAGTCGGTGNNRTVTFPSIDAQRSATVIITAAVNNNASPGTSFTNTAALSAVSFDPNPSNNQASVTTAVVSPPAGEVRNGLIAFGYTGLNLVRPDGTSRFSPVFGQNPEWSPDGTRLAFGTSQGISIINADGSGQRVLTANGSSPTWSPDGTRIAFHRFLTGIVVANVDGTGERTVLTDFSRDLGILLKWSPDGTKLALSDDSIYLFNLDGSGLARLTTPPSQARDEYPNWSRDGMKIVFARTNLGFTGDFYTINPDGTGLARLGNLAGRYPVFSPDGTRLAYAESNGQLAVSNADGSSPRRIVDESPNNVITGIDWQRAPASQQATFVISGRIRAGDSGLFTNVELSGTRTATVSTGSSSGYYAFGYLPEGGGYTVRPVSNFFRFEPPSRTFNNLTADQQNADFTATRITTTIRGRITDFSGAPIGGVVVSAGSDARAETDADGNYRISNLSGGTGYTVTPVSILGGDVFEPRSITFPASDGDKIADFKGIRERFALIGQVVDVDGAPVADASVALSGAGASASATTNAQGRYSFGNLAGGHVYTVSVSKTGAAFSPAARRVLLNRNQDVRFISVANSFTAVSAANFNPQGVTVGGIFALFGEGLSLTTRAAIGTSLPFELDGVSVYFSNRNISQTRCQLFFVSPRQINAVIPFPNSPSDASSIAGEALLEVRQSNRVVAANSVQIERFAPAIVTADSSGRGLAAAVALRIKADGTQTFEPVFRFDPQTGQFVAVPIDLGNPAEQVYAVFFGTGIRFRHDPSGVRVRIGGEDAMVSFAGPQPTLFAVDQVNALIPRSLAGRGEVDVTLTADGVAANPVKLNIK